MQTDIWSRLYSLDGVEISARGKPITDRNGVDEVVRKSRPKYGEGDVKMYYINVDLAVYVSILQNPDWNCVHHLETQSQI